MNHTLRLAVLLLFIIVVLFIVVPRVLPARLMLTTSSRLQEQNDAILWANQPLQYADPAICGTCHQTNSTTLNASKHRSVSCETCHGAGEPHMEKQTPPEINTSREACGICHATVVGRPKNFPQVEFQTHGGEALCVTCHSPHNPTIVVGTDTSGSAKPTAAPTIPHSLEGRSDCNLCHAKGGLKPYPDDHAGRGVNSCLACHKNK